MFRRGSRHLSVNSESVAGTGCEETLFTLRETFTGMPPSLLVRNAAIALPVHPVYYQNRHRQTV